MQSCSSGQMSPTGRTATETNDENNQLDCNSQEHTSCEFVVTEQKSNSQFYTKAQEYWSAVPATVDGMLGGLGYINALDVQGSKKFLQDIKSLGNQFALDCGAGIGRVSKNVLLPRFNTVDMVEQDPTFAGKARDYCSQDAGATLGFPRRIGKIYNMGLQHFSPQQKKYDLIWSQWVLSHLTDADLINFFQRMRSGLADKGYFVIKENVTSTNEIEEDDKDSSVTRPLKMFEKLLKQAGFRIIKTTRQQNFPKGLYPVYMIASRPCLTTT